MKERFKFECFKIYNEKKGLEEMQYFRIKQELIWQFYIRPIKLWFQPCDKCQGIIDKEYESMILGGFMGDMIRFPLMVFSTRLCRTCKKYIWKRAFESFEVILGNKEYEPPMELSRKWLDDEDSRIRISEEDYKQRNEQAEPYIDNTEQFGQLLSGQDGLN